MAANRSQNQLALIGAFINKLYVLGGYGTWKEFADDAKISPAQVSDFQLGKVEPAGYNLFSLIEAASARAQADSTDLSARLAREVASDKLAQIDSRLEEFSALTLEALARLEAGIAPATKRRTPSSAQAPVSKRR